MTTYTIVINEYQRGMLYTLIEAGLLSDVMRDYLKAQSGDIEPDMLQEVKLFKDMLLDLPRVEYENPGVTHGLCL